MKLLSKRCTMAGLLPYWAKFQIRRYAKLGLQIQTRLHRTFCCLALQYL